MPVSFPSQAMPAAPRFSSEVSGIASKTPSSLIFVKDHPVMRLDSLRIGEARHVVAAPAPPEKNTATAFRETLGQFVRQARLAAMALGTSLKQPWSVRFSGLEGETARMILQPGAVVWEDPQQQYAENFYGRNNRYYHQFRRLAGVISAEDFSAMGTERAGELLQTLAEEKFLKIYRGREFEFTVTPKVAKERSQFLKFMETQGLSATERAAFLLTLSHSEKQRAKKIRTVDESSLSELPLIFIGDGEVEVLQGHHRIRGAEDFGIAIAVNGTLAGGVGD